MVKQGRVAELGRDGAREEVVVDGDVVHLGTCSELGRDRAREEVVGQEQPRQVLPVAQPRRNGARQLVAFHRKRDDILERRE